MNRAILSRGRQSMLSKPAKASAFYLISSAAAKVVGFLVTPIFTRLISGEGYGEYTLYMSWLGFVSLTVTSVFSGAVIYKGLSENQNKKSEYISASLGAALAISAAICVLLFTFLPFLGIEGDLVLILSLQIVCDIILSISFIYSRFSYDYLRVGLLTLAQAVISPILGIAIISSFDIGYRGRIYGLFIASLVIALPSLASLLKKSAKIFDKELWKSIFKRSAPLFPHALSNSLSLQIDRFIISAVMGQASLAKYSVAHSLGAGLTMAVSAACAALNPWIVRKLSRGEENAVSLILGRGAELLASSVMLLVVLAPPAMQLLAPPEYSDSISAVLPIALATLPSFISSAAAVGLVFKERSASVSVCAVISSIASIGLGFALIPAFGYFGAGLAQLISQLILALLSTLALSRADAGGMLPSGKAVFAFLFSAVFSVVAYLCRERYAVRLGLLLIGAAIFFYQAVKLFSLVKEK